jgi:peptidoglycan/xylan/chitin deacetylase (PgdA/CDA1 family)
VPERRAPPHVEHRLAITVDVEDWYHIPSVTGSPFAKYKDVEQLFASWSGRYDYLTEPTMRTLEMLDEYGVTATYFVVADVVERYPGLVRAIARQGHEIACHGWHHACAIHPKTKQPLMSREEFAERTRTAARVLEDETGAAVIGYRAPSAYIAGWMVDVLESLGFRYDSSVAANSLFNKSDTSLREVGSAPYWPQNGGLAPGARRSIVELPWPYFRLGFRFPCGGGPLLRLLGRRYIDRGIRESLQRGDSVFYFHPIDLSAERFPAPFSAHRPLFWLIKGRRVERRIRALLARYSHRSATCERIVAGFQEHGS